MKRKDYLKLFVSYCKAYHIYYAVCGDGVIDDVCFCDEEDEEFWPNIPFGSKAAYDWLLRTHKEILLALIYQK